MNCNKTKPLLADYLNNELSKEIEKDVKKHIELCEKCMQEINFLKSYFNEVKNIKTVEAPENLLDKIHIRLKQKSSLKKMLKKLFIPFQIKIPIQLATVTTAVILILLLFNPLKQFFIHKPPQIADKTNNETKSKNKNELLALKEKDTEDKKDKEIINTEKKERPKIQPKKLYKVSLLLIPETTEIENPLLKTRGIKKDENQSNISLKENHSKTVELIISLGGKIISPKNYKNTTDFNSLLFDIPEDKYQIFIEKLNNLGTITIKDSKEINDSYNIELKYNK